MELAGLEVATGKIAMVMKTVGTWCNVTLSHLPPAEFHAKINDSG